VQIERPMRLAPVQVDGDAGDRDVRHHQRVDENLQPGSSGEALVEKGQNGIQQIVRSRRFIVAAGWPPAKLVQNLTLQLGSCAPEFHNSSF
jgi:hypothetical protein